MTAEIHKLHPDGSAPSQLALDAGAVAADAAGHLLALQQADGHIVYELEADATIPAEFIFLNHFLGDPDPETELKLAAHIRSLQNEAHGGWPLFFGGGFNISASVKAYYALKMIGDDPTEPHMVRAREAILAHGGAETSNVFTRYALALFAQVPWKAVPVMPVELMLMPKWFPVNMWKFAYWSRTVIAPLLILAALKPVAKNPGRVDCQELFVTKPADITKWQVNPTGSQAGEFFLVLDQILRPLETYVFPRFGWRKKALQKAVEFITPRLNGEDGLGAIFPAIANSVMAFDALGLSRNSDEFRTARSATRKLLIETSDKTDGRSFYCQPCVSPIWDTSLAGHALLEAGVEPDDERLIAACDWLAENQITDVKGDYAINAPDLEPGGWAFQYRNDYYPDVDDTAVVGALLHRTDPARYASEIARAAVWIEGMQSSNGGWGAFDINNNASILNSIPFADHGALLDPPTVDVTARCLSFLAQLGYPQSHQVIARGIDFIQNEQEADGSWYGRWGTNYVYGTWSALTGLNAVGVDMKAPYVRRAVDWLKVHQREDGGWGEDGATYWHERRYECKSSTPSQTAWGVLALMAAGEVEDPAVASGVKHLIDAPREEGKWDEPWFTAVGFPRVFYLRYHGYSAYFPTWALGRYGQLMKSNSREVQWGL